MADAKDAKSDEFLKKYEELCKETERQLVVTPMWVQRDDGSFSTVLQMSVQKVQAEQPASK